MNQCIWAWRMGWLGWLIGTIASFPQMVKAQVVPDDTLGAERSQVRPDTIRGTDSDRIEGGARRGQNLFHSFQQFSVQEGRGAYFLNPDGVRNIFSRVTGGGRSDILGRLGVISPDNATLGTANLFLINPNGIVFGRNSSLDVGGSFIGTTANGLQFGDRGFFNATNPEAPSDVLTINPSAFFFNQIPVGNISNSSNAPTGAVTPSGSHVLGLQVPDGQNLLLVGGDTSMDGGRLNALGGRIELGGLAGTGAIGLDTTGNTFRLNFPANALLSNLTLANDARVSTRGNRGGDIVVSTNVFNATTGGRLVNGTEGAGNAGDITVNSREFNITGIGLSGSGSGVYNQVISGGSGNSGNITINTHSFNASLGASIGNTVLFGATGNAGNISIRTASLFLNSAATLETRTYGSGNAGNLSVQANSVALSDSSYIFNNVESGGIGNGGNIDIKTNLLSLTNGSQIQAILRDADTASGLAGGRGIGGSIHINVRDAFTAIGRDKGGLPSEISTNVGSGAVGNGGNINVKSGSISLLDGGIFTDVGTGAEGNAGDIFIRAGSLSLNSLPGSVNSRSDISTTTSGRGNAGNMILLVDGTISLKQRSYIFSFIDGRGIGNAGDIHIQAQSFILQDGAQVAASVFRTENGIPGGQGRGGTVRINVSDFVTVTGLGLQGFSSGIYANTQRGASGQGGDIFITTGALRVADGAVITTQTLNPSNGGDITINARTFDAAGGGQVLASSFGGGNAGNITMNVSDRATLSGRDRGYTRRLDRYGRDIVANVSPFSGVFATTEGTDSTGNGGAIAIRANDLSLTNDAQISATTSGRGNAGNITVQNPEAVSLTNNAAIAAGTEGRGNAGNIDIQNAYVVSIASGSNISTTVGRDGSGQGGAIAVNARNLNLTDGSRISAQSQGRGRAGNITLNASRQLNATDSTIATSAPNSSGGNISINRDTAFGAVVLQDSDITTDSKGDGGNINIRGAGTIAFGDSDILADSIRENGGDITLGRYFGGGQTSLPTNSPFENDGQPDVNAQGNRTSGDVSTTDTSFIQNSLNELSVDSIDTGTLLSNSCIVRDRQQGSFRITGTDNFPDRPGSANSSPYPTGTIRSIPATESPHSQTNRPWQIGDAIVEPQGVYRLPDGRLVMSRECSE